MTDLIYAARHRDGGLRMLACARPGYWRDLPMPVRRTLRRRTRRALRAQAKRGAA